MSTTVGTVSGLQPGRMKAYHVGANEITVANVDGRFFAFGDTCPHRGCSLATGTLEGQVVTCACHGSQFDVSSGEVLRGPADEGVETWPVRIEGDAISIEG